MDKNKKSIIDVLLYPQSSLDFIFVTGLPGAGKTTFAANWYFKNHFEADQWMVDDTKNYYFDPKKLGYCHSQCLQATENAMITGEEVIVSNTSLTKKEAKPYFLLAKKYKYNIVLIHLMTEYKSIHNVPENKLQQMFNRRELYKINEII
jgi:predicted kinase